MAYWRRYRPMLIRLGILLLILGIVRYIFWRYNAAAFPQDWSIAEIMGYFLKALRFDLSTVLYINALYIFSEIIGLHFSRKRWISSLQKVLFFIPNLIFLSIEIGDIVFYSFQSRRIIFSDKNLIINTLTMLPTLMFRYWFLLIIGVVLIIVLWRAYERANNKTDTILSFSTVWKKGLLCSIVTLLSASLIIIGGRGGLQRRPINMGNASTYVKKPQWSPLLYSSTFSILNTAFRKSIEEKQYFTDAQLDTLYSLTQKIDTTQAFRPLNVVVIAMESFGKEISTRYNDGEGYTPFLDSLSEHSLTTKGSFANGLRSTFGIVAMTSSIPCLMDEPLMFSPYQNNRVHSIATLLKEKGYSTSFFHGSIPGSMGFDKYTKSVDYDIFEDMTHYPNTKKDFDGQWGIFDRPYFEYVAERIDKMPKPCHTFLFSLSAHEPYHVEADFEARYPDMDAQHRAELYADMALRNFMEACAKKPWFEQTLFVIAADHTGRAREERFRRCAGRYAIPILYYFPKGNLKGELPTISQQIDILPTIMDILHYDKPFSSFGKSILQNDNQKRYCMRYDWDGYLINDEQYILMYDAEHNEIAALFDYQKDQTKDIKAAYPKVCASLLEALQARIQRHHKVMILNKF